MTANPREAEREVEQARAGLEHTLNELKQKLSIDGLLDQASAHLTSGNTAQFVSNLGKQLRDNPLPAALIGIGMAWMMTSDRGIVRGSRTKGGHTSREAVHPSNSAVVQAGEYVHAAGEGRETAEGGTDSIGEGMQRVRETGDEVWGQAESGLNDAVDKVRLASRSVSEMRVNTQERITEFIEQQPLTAAAVGLAFGALLGALLPKTKVEDAYLGETADQVRGRVSESGGELYEKGKIAATEAYRDAVQVHSELGGGNDQNSR